MKFNGKTLFIENIIFEIYVLNEIEVNVLFKMANEWNAEGDSL